MTARVKVEYNLIQDGVNVWLGRSLEDGTGTELYLAGELTRVLAAPGTTFKEPSLFLSGDLARALYVELGRHFGETDTRGYQTLSRMAESLTDRVTLLERQVSERATVDKLTG